MYEQVFHFHARPFTATPFVQHYFAASAMDQALAHTRLCVDRAAGPVVAIGDVGLGKSLYLAMLEAEYQSAYTVVNLGCSRLETRKDLLQSILFKMNQPVIGRTEAELRFTLMDLTRPTNACPDGMLLLVDDAESLSVELIDELRLITNYIIDGQPRVRLVMAGRQGLEDALADPRLASFNQRIAARCYLHALSSEETAAYVLEHIDRVGGQGAQLFPAPALKRIHELTLGCPRLVNQICEVALILCGTSGLSEISKDLIDEAWADVQCLPGEWSPRESAQQQQMKDDPDWTVIEFGQLPDEHSDEPPVYEFHQKPGTAADVDATLEPAEAAAEVAPEEWHAPAMREPSPAVDAPADRTDAEFGPVASSGTNVLPPPAEVPENNLQHSDHVDFDQLAEAARQLALNVPDNALSRGGDNEASEADRPPSEQDLELAQRQAEETRAEMEAQLAAVFGNLRTAPSPAEEPAFSDAAADAPSLNAEPVVPQPDGDMEPVAQEGTPQSTFPTADEQVTASWSEYPSVTPNQEAPSHWAAVEPHPVVGAESAWERPLAGSSAAPLGQGFQPDTPAEEMEPAAEGAGTDSHGPVPVEVHAEAVSPASADTTWAPEPAIEDEGEAADLVTSGPQAEPAPAETSSQGQSISPDPFAESFADEEPLRDRFAPIIAQHNVASLSVSSADLEFVQPDDLEPSSEPSLTFHAAPPLDATQDPVFDGQPAVTPKAAADSNGSWPVATDPSLQEDAAAHPAWSEPASDVQPESNFEAEVEAEVEAEPVAAADQEYEDRFTAAADSMEEAPAKADWDPYQSQQLAQAAPELPQPPAAPPQAPASQPSAEVPPLPIPPAPARPIVSDEIARQVDAIMKRLDQARALSQMAEPTLEEPVTADSAAEPVPPTARAPEAVEPEEDASSTGDRSEQILEEIRRQRAMIAEQVGSPEAPPTNRPATMPTGRASTPTVGPEDVGADDDDDLIVVNYMNQAAAAKPAAKPTDLPFKDTPVSTGRAQRMDYEQLFEQLRRSETEDPQDS